MKTTIQYRVYRSPTPEEYKDFPVEIMNARTIKLPGLQSLGFELIPHNIDELGKLTPTLGPDSNDLHRYHYKLAKLGLEKTDADCVLVNKSRFRSTDQEEDLPPAVFAHNDLTSNAFEILGYKFKHLDFSNLPSFIGHASKKIHDPSPTIKRWAMFKAWRNTGETNPCSQMAWCDPTSIHPLEMINYKVPDHLVKKYIEANNDPNYSHHMLLFSKKPEITHNWYYYSEMTYDEVVLFRLYDSSLLKTKRWFTPHSSFLFPGRQDTPRSSIETEINCLWFD